MTIDATNPNNNNINIISKQNLLGRLYTSVNFLSA